MSSVNSNVNTDKRNVQEHKMASFRYHITRMHSLPLTPKKKQKEWKSIQLIARNNNFPQICLYKLNRQMQHKKKINHDQTEGRNKNKTHTTVQE